MLPSLNAVPGHTRLAIKNDKVRNLVNREQRQSSVKKGLPLRISQLVILRRTVHSVIWSAIHSLMWTIAKKSDMAIRSFMTSLTWSNTRGLQLSTAQNSLNSWRKRKLEKQKENNRLWGIYYIHTVLLISIKYRGASIEEVGIKSVLKSLRYVQFTYDHETVFCQ